jgi:uncharacterized membrane protein
MKSISIRVTSIVLAFISAVSSLILMMEKIELWKNPDYIPSCSWNPLFSCQGPMNSWQSSALFIPNPIIGIIGYTILIMVLVLSLQAKLPKWVWGGYLFGVTSSLGYLTWLQFQTIYDIKALCIYCMVVWACAIPLFWLAVKGFIDTHYSKTRWSIISRLTPALITAHYLTLATLIYLQFMDFFHFLLGI